MSTLDGRLFGEDQPCFGCAPNHPIGFRLSFETAEDGVTTTMTPGERYQGPPGIMHGGLVMTLADEIAAWSLIAKYQKFGFTVSADCKLKGPIRIGAPVQGRGRVIKERRGIVHVEVVIEQNGAVALEGAMRFVILDRASAEKLLEQPIPAAWEKFSG